MYIVGLAHLVSLEEKAMTWEELAKFIMEMPEEESKRPAWLVCQSCDESGEFLIEFNIRKIESEDLEFFLEMENHNTKIKPKKGDWVIE